MALGKALEEAALQGTPAGSTSNLAEALITTADRQLWARYCRLSAALEGIGRAAPRVCAVGSVEWQEQRVRLSQQPLTEEDEAAGRRQLARRSAPLAFAGVPSPLGAAGGAAFDQFIARHRGPPALLAEIGGVEQELVSAFELAGRSGRYRAAGFCDGTRKELDPVWYGRVQLDFGRNAVVLPDRTEIVGVEVTIGAPSASGGPGQERPARAMLREALVKLWERGAFTAGTGNERVLALALRELGLSASDPPYGFKSAETVRKLRKTLKMSL
jgi:hypothetical protein